MTINLDCFLLDREREMTVFAQMKLNMIWTLLDSALSLLQMHVSSE